MPVGKYALAALTRLGAWQQVEPRLIRVENVRSALAFVARGEATLGIVYATDAKIESKVRVVDTFPGRLPSADPLPDRRHGDFRRGGRALRRICRGRESAPPVRQVRVRAARVAGRLQSAAMKLAVVILAAGQGKRMKSSLPKMLQPLAGRPMLSHVIETARSLEPASIHVVYGHGGDRVREALQAQPVSWVLQKEQLGTGHAVMQALPHVRDEDLVLILAGDVPMIRRQTLADFTQLAGPKAMALLTVMLADPTGYGRVLRNASGQVRRIVEEKDASKAERKVRECNSGIMAIPGKHLRSWLGRVKNDNTQGEYYLTDVIALAVKDKIAIKPLISPSPEEVLGVNDKAQLADVEAIRAPSGGA